MVWNSTQSALYKAVSSYNDGRYEGKNDGGNKVQKNVQKSPDFSPRNNEKKSADDRARDRCEKCPRNDSAACPKNVPSDPLSRIMSDRDMLLIAGLIFILWHENADKKLIMALAIVLLG